MATNNAVANTPVECSCSIPAALAVLDGELLVAAASTEEGIDEEVRSAVLDGEAEEDDDDEESPDEASEALRVPHLFSSLHFC